MLLEDGICVEQTYLDSVHNSNGKSIKLSNICVWCESFSSETKAIFQHLKRLRNRVCLFHLTSFENNNPARLRERKSVASSGQPCEPGADWKNISWKKNKSQSLRYCMTLDFCCLDSK